MPDIISDRRITQEEAGQLMAPLELDLLSAFKVMQEDILTGMENYEGTPEQYIEEVLKNLSGTGEVGEMAVLKGKPLPVGTRRQRSDGVYIKQPNGDWVKETEQKRKNGISKETKKWIDKIDELEKKDVSFNINNSTRIMIGYKEYNKYQLWTEFGKKVNTFPNKETFAKYLSGEIKDIKYKLPKSTDKQIEIVDIEDSYYKGQDMKWTETFDYSEVLKTDMIAYHYSDKPIKNFAKKETCFFPDPYDYTDIGYKIIIPAGTKINWYKSGEIRVEITENMKINQLKKGWSEYDEIK